MDAKDALAAVSTFEPSSFASHLEVEIAQIWARTKPIELIENIEEIAEQSRWWPLETAFSKIAREDPAKAILLLNSVESLVENSSSILAVVVESWALQQPIAAADWVLNNTAEKDPDRQVLLRRVLPYLAEQTPVPAFELAMEESEPSDRLGLEYFVIKRIAFHGDIELAKQLLPRVRESTKNFAYLAVASAMIDLNQTSEALELGKALGESKQESYYVRLLSSWANRKPQNLYESLKNLPSSTIQAIAAQALILRSWHDPIFTDDQIDHVKMFLGFNDEASLKR